MKIANTVVFIAYTHLRVKKLQTIIAIAGVTFGIVVFIFLLGCVRGVSDSITELSLEQVSDIRIFNEVRIEKENVIDKIYPKHSNVIYHQKPKNKALNIKDANKILYELKNDPNIKSISGTVKTQVYYKYGSSEVAGVITGINYSDENRLLNIEEKFIDGEASRLISNPNSIVMGYRLAKRLNLKIDDKILITADNGHKFTAVVVGIIKTGLPDLDKEICYMSRKSVQAMLDAPISYITDINIKLHDRTLAPKLAEKLSIRYDSSSSDWIKDNPILIEGEGMQNLIYGFVAISILFVAGFGIYNILNMMIYEKMKDIAIIKAMGFSNNNIKMIFMLQALTIGVLGSIAGLFLGYLLSWLTTFIPFKSEYLINMEHFPMHFDIKVYIGGLLFGLLTTALAGYLPSKKASKLDPISILRG